MVDCYLTERFWDQSFWSYLQLWDAVVVRLSSKAEFIAYFIFDCSSKPFFLSREMTEKKKHQNEKKKNKVRPWPWLPYHDLRSEMSSSKDPARRFWVYIIEKANTRYQSLPMTLLLSFLLTLFIAFFIYNKREQRGSFHKGKPLSQLHIQSHSPWRLSPLYIHPLEKAECGDM